MFLNDTTFDVPAPRNQTCGECTDPACIGHVWMVEHTVPTEGCDCSDCREYRYHNGKGWGR